MRSLLLRLSRAVCGWPPSPSSPSEKHSLVARFAGSAANLIETGTFEGDMIEAQRSRYRRIITIEVVEELFQAARHRFAAYPHILVLLGDSGQVMPEAIRLAEGPTVFWLDGHYSGGVTGGGNSNPPILAELATIASRREPSDVILIDDARLFGWRSGYPKVSTMRKFAAEHWPRHRFVVESDVIQILPK